MKIAMSVACMAVVLLAITVQPSIQNSECETKREAAEKLISQQKPGSSALAILVPSCNDDGTYKTLQCHYNSSFCQCWDKEGLPLSQPKKNLQKCSCMVDRAKALKSIPPSQTGTAELTSCENDGSYTAKQCNRDACWCVDKESGKKLGDENKDKPSVRC